MKKWKKFFTCFMVLLILVISVSYSFFVVRASSVSVPFDLSTIIYFLNQLSVSCHVLESTDLISSELSDEQNAANAEKERELLNQCLDYYQTYGGDSSKICYMTADGSVVSLEKALQDATSMSVDDYIDMRKESNSPTPQPGIDWRSIFIDSAVGGLMDFLADFLINKKGEEDGYTYSPTFYTGDDGYIDRSTGELHVFIEHDTLNSYCTGFVKAGGLLTRNAVLTSSIAKEKFRMCIVIDSNDSLAGFNIDHKYYLADGKITNSSNAVLGKSYYSILQTGFSSSELYAQRALGNMTVVRGECAYAFKGNDFHNFVYFSTNLPVFDNYEEAESYLLWGSFNDIKPDLYTDIKAICNNYKNKVVSVDTVKSYGLTPTPTPKPTNTPIPTPTNTSTPTPTPYPTWDKNSGNGNNFTIYNFYTEINNDFTLLQVSIDNIKETLTNIYNFFIIDVEQISMEMTFESPAYKFEPVTKAVNTLKDTFEEDKYDDVTGLLCAEYPKLSMKCPKILQSIVDTYDENGEKEIVIVDFKDYALWFVRLRKFLEAILWVGMVFYLMKEIKVIFTI